MLKCSRFVELCERFRFMEDQQFDKGDPNARKRLADLTARIRSDGLRIKATLTPDLHRVLLAVAEELRLPEAPEAYIVPDPRLIAAAPAFAVRDRPVILLSSGLVQLLEPAELKFVYGHELGHLGLGHPGAGFRRVPSSEFEALKSRALSRCAEISADRIGLVSGRSLVTAANVMVKLASGLTSSHLTLNTSAFLEQVKRDPEETSREWELYQLHPSLPIRLWALMQFSQTGEYLDLAKTGQGRISLCDVDRRISERLSSLGDGSLSQMEQHKYDTTIAWVGAALVLDDGIIEDKEEAQLRDLIGGELAGKALRFARDHGIDPVLMKLEHSLSELGSGGERLLRRIAAAHSAFAEKLGVEPEASRSGHLIKRILKKRFGDHAEWRLR